MIKHVKIFLMSAHKVLLSGHPPSNDAIFFLDNVSKIHFYIRLCSVTRIFENPPGFPEDFWITILRICPKILQSVRLADANFFLTSYCIYQYKFFFLYSSSLHQLPLHQLEQWVEQLPLRGQPQPQPHSLPLTSPVNGLLLTMMLY